MLKLPNLKVAEQRFHSYTAWPFLYKQPWSLWSSILGSSAVTTL